MKNLRQILKEAEEKKVAVGHFNFADLIGFKAIVEAAEELGVPVILGTSEGEAKFVGREQAVALVKSLQKAGKPVFLNSDHTKSLEEVKKAADAGYDAILFDGGTLPLEENIRQTKEVVEYIKSINPEIIIEGELGNIGSGSSIRKELPKGLGLSLSKGAAKIRPEDLTKPEDAARFLKETEVDLLAPAVGNLHGMFIPLETARPMGPLGAQARARSLTGFAKGYDYPLDIERIQAIKKAVKIPLVLHGGSGNTDADFLAAIDAGVAIIHINTEIRVAWRKGLESGLHKDIEEIAPYKVEPEAVEVMKAVVKARLKLFNKLS
ncbi:MAG: class II fructose-bisphosphate aldolase [bacterium]|nr:class II fructose-bisphosphate aldolase [bacterium]